MVADDGDQFTFGVAGEPPVSRVNDGSIVGADLEPSGTLYGDIERRVRENERALLQIQHAGAGRLTVLAAGIKDGLRALKPGVCTLAQLAMHRSMRIWAARRADAAVFNWASVNWGRAAQGQIGVCEDVAAES